MISRLSIALSCLFFGIQPAFSELPTKKYNVLFIISDDLTSTALSCYGNKVCKTPNIDAIAAKGTRFTRAYCQGTFCGPSAGLDVCRVITLMPRAWWDTSAPGKQSATAPPGHSILRTQDTTRPRVSKIYHMGVPGGIEKGTNGADDAASWTERFNSQGPEWKAPGKGETLEGNPNGKKGRS